MSKIRVSRMLVFEIDPEVVGFCRNEQTKKRAGEEICSVGIIRRGRSWGDYDGQYCAECPYWIPPCNICEFFDSIEKKCEISGDEQAFCHTTDEKGYLLFRPKRE
jgi:hypothetical protein